MLVLVMTLQIHSSVVNNTAYHQISNISHTFVDNQITCRRCSNYIFIVSLIHSFDKLGKDNCKTTRETFKFCDLVQLISESWWYIEIIQQ